MDDIENQSLHVGPIKKPIKKPLGRGISLDGLTQICLTLNNGNNITYMVLANNILPLCTPILSMLLWGWPNCRFLLRLKCYFFTCSYLDLSKNSEADLMIPGNILYGGKELCWSRTMLHFQPTNETIYNCLISTNRTAAIFQILST